MLLLMEIPLLKDMIIILGISMLVILIINRFKLPTIIGFLISGVVVGPHAFDFVGSENDVEILAEIGVVLLLFSIGLEFSLSNLLRIKKAVLLGGGLQVLLTIVAFAVISYLLGYDYLPTAIFLGFMFCLSSTAIVLKLFQISGQMGTAHGQMVLAMMIFQDIAVVPMMLLTPIMTGQTENLGQELMLLGGKIVGVGIFLVICAKFIVPRLLFEIAKTKSKELFISSVLVICFAIAWLTAMAGLSLALGAFMAGLIIAESEYSHEAASYALPFKEIFTSIFFISIGMLLDVKFLLSNILLILGLTLLTMVVKAFMATLAAKSLKIPFRVAFMVGLSIAQVGEFSFVLSKSGVEAGLLPIEIYQYFLAIAVCSMAFTPFILDYSKRIVNFILLKSPIPKKFRQKLIRENLDKLNPLDHSHELKEHIVIIGANYMGLNLARGAKAAELSYIMVELNPSIVKQARSAGESIVFGDATNEEILTHIRVEKAKVAVVLVRNEDTTPKIIHSLRKLNPELFIVVRTKHSYEIEHLRSQGADEVIADEDETIFEIFSQTLDQYFIPKFEHFKLARMIREKV